MDGVPLEPLARAGLEFERPIILGTQIEGQRRQWHTAAGCH
jgi:hypothetical protein